MPSHVRGPFIEFDCSKCGRVVQSNADMTRDRLHDLIVEKNNDPAKRICAGCGNQPQTLGDAVRAARKAATGSEEPPAPKRGFA